MEQDKTRRKYEVVYIIDETKEPVSNFCTRIKEGMGKMDVTIVSEEDMGKRIFAYPINKLTEGHYYLFTIDMAPEKVKDLGDLCKHEESVLRHLVVKK